MQQGLNSPCICRIDVKGQETEAGNFDYLAMSTTHRNPIVERRSRPGHTNSSFVAR